LALSLHPKPTTNILNMKKIIILSSVALLCISLISCSARKVQRVSPDKQIDLSGRWNDVDSKMVADGLIEQILSRSWINDFTQKNSGKKPTVVVGLVTNKSHEHISAETFIKDLEKALLYSDRVRLVQAGDKREELRKERADQQDFASAETAKKWGKELGADYILQGDINSIVDQYGKEKVVNYKVNLELTDLETNEIVFIGDKEIKKYITN